MFGLYAFHVVFIWVAILKLSSGLLRKTCFVALCSSKLLTVSWKFFCRQTIRSVCFVFWNWLSRESNISYPPASSTVKRLATLMQKQNGTCQSILPPSVNVSVLILASLWCLQPVINHIWPSRVNMLICKREVASNKSMHFRFLKSRHWINLE